MNSKGINTIIHDFEQNIVQVVNESGLPASIIRIVFEKMLSQVRDIEAGALETEREEAGKDGA